MYIIVYIQYVLFFPVDVDISDMIADMIADMMDRNKHHHHI